MLVRLLLAKQVEEVTSVDITDECPQYLLTQHLLRRLMMN